MSDASVDVFSNQSEWGLTVSEVTARRTPVSRILLVGAYVLFGAASLLAMPIILGALFFPNSDGLLFEFAIVALVLALAMAFSFKAGKKERNAVQIDYRATELRLGTQKSDGTFIREKVYSFREIDNVTTGENEKGAPTLELMIAGVEVSLAFNGNQSGSVENLATQIAAARESALRAPMSKRIQSKAHGIEASFREIKSRVQSRIAHA
jgi:hypothetical protein